MAFPDTKWQIPGTRYQIADRTARSAAEMYCIRGITPGRDATPESGVVD